MCKLSKFSKFKTKQLLGNSSVKIGKNLIVNRVEESYLAFTKNFYSTHTTKNILILFHGLNNWPVLLSVIF